MSAKRTEASASAGKRKLNAYSNIDVADLSLIRPVLVISLNFVTFLDVSSSAQVDSTDSKVTDSCTEIPVFHELRFAILALPCPSAVSKCTCQDRHKSLSVH